MGADTTRQAVTDAGPLIHLNEIGSLSLLYVFDEIHVTDTVWAEATMPNRVATTRLTALAHLRKHRVTRNDMARFIVGANLALLHLGEQTSLYLIHRLEFDLILTDDLAAREAAKSMGLRPVGS